MRDVVKVSVTQEEYLALRGLLGLAYNQAVLDGKRYPAVERLAENIRKDLEDEPGDLIEIARREYQTDEVNVDDDAPLSRADTGTWVGAWVWVSDEDEREGGEEGE